MIQHRATVKHIKLLARDIWQAELSAPEIARCARPGQFINILPVQDWSAVMRRPMSIAGIREDAVRIIFKVVGEGTRLMSGWQSGQEVDIIGPLGNWWTDYDHEYPILMGGGVGLAPILFLHEDLIRQGIRHALVLGARTHSEHFLVHNVGEARILTTDDGTTGIKGTVLDGVEEVLKTARPSAVKLFACGPSPMMEAVRVLAVERKYACDLALEQIMACGFGNCQGCVVERKHGPKTGPTYRHRFALVCKDGPIFNARELA